MRASAGIDHPLLHEHRLLPSGQRLRREMELVAELIDLPYYRTNTPGVGDLDPVEHFCRRGWRELRKPSQDFDVWWYWMAHLDPADDSLNPLVHYALVGRELGLSTRPATTKAGPGHRLPTTRPVRRACLVAGFDTDGVVDPSVVSLIAELSRHGDVFYLFDGYLDAAELAKVEDITVASWAIRHGAYDFGSYSRLASDLVGWDRLATYDEVVLVNDSCFVVRPLDEVFATMAERECDWWGLQATKGIVDAPSLPPNRITSPVPVDTVRSELLDGFEDDPVYNFHLGSYFLAFRRPVLESAEFRRLIESVVPQPSKRLIVLKYEIGLTHLLVGSGFTFDTFMDRVYPFHPMFSDWYFTMLERGFPLLKRFLLYRNHYDVPDLARWKERVLAVVPDADVDQIEQTLLRATPDDQLQRSMAISVDDDGQVVVPEVVSVEEYRRRNRKTAKRPDSWVFAVDRRTHRLPDNSRAIFEAVKDDPSITKILLTRSRRLELSGANVITAPLLSPAGREHLLSSGTVLVEEAPRPTLDAPVLAKHQTIVVVRRGLQLEKSGRTLQGPRRMPASRGARTDPPALAHPLPPSVVTGLLVASDLDQLATLATHWPASFEHGWRTGVPAHDFLLGEEDALPADLHAQLEDVRRQLRGRRLLLFAPTRRASGTRRAPHDFSKSEIESLQVWCDRHDFVLGLREVENDLERAYSTQLGGVALDLSPRRYPSAHAVLRAAGVVLTDYSGLALDFAATGKPVVSFAHDLETAADSLLYDLHHFFPGPVAETFEALGPALDLVAEGISAPHHRRVRDMLIDHRDGHNTERVLERLMTQVEGAGR
ncbi:rhamnan synthesis F family protein [Aeromicrobium yanjiei]|uniref:Uncharacterized protein n=1 Tax=Aeromicrobium yanjiei TaxID=2662028 RepID=A0A5Q2MGJ9_9ACTN|nr:rhamnan synthesis F family protein [Aeromicrobium yanjiei]QGG40831.1 hypothetical protein GEV26_05360 [Aeromicrobium yanjiei]